MPASANAGSNRSAKQCACLFASSRAMPRVFSRIWSGALPLTLSTGRPVAIRRIRPATRTMKNSSRALAKIDSNLTRSSSGTFGSSASSSTRWANRSQLSSRSRYRSAGSSGRSPSIYLSFLCRGDILASARENSGGPFDAITSGGADQPGIESRTRGLPPRTHGLPPVARCRLPGGFALRVRTAERDWRLLASPLTT